MIGSDAQEVADDVVEVAPGVETYFKALRLIPGLLRFIDIGGRVNYRTSEDLFAFKRKAERVMAFLGAVLDSYSYSLLHDAEAVRILVEEVRSEKSAREAARDFLRRSLGLVGGA